MAITDMLPPGTQPQQNPLAPPLIPGITGPLMPPPPPSPSLGFQVWAGSPDNAMKVQPSMTAADAPLQPNAGQPMASLTPPPTKMQQALTPPVIPGMDQAQSQLSGDQANLRSLQQSGAAANHVKNPVLRTLAQIGNIAAPFLLGRGAMAIPGTTAHNLFLQEQAQGRVNNDQENVKGLLSNADTQAQMAQRGAQAQKEQSQSDAYTPVTLTAEQAAAVGHPELAGEQMPPKTYSALLVGAQKADSAENVQGLKNTGAQTIQQMKNQVAQMKPKQRDDQYIAIMSKPANERTAEDNAFVQGYKAMINTKVTQPGVAKAAAFGNNRVVQTVDPNTDNVVYQHAGDAINSGAAAPSSAAYKSDSALMKDFTSGNAAKNLTSFNTASGHLQTLGEAAKALHNGDIQGVNRIANEYAKQTGQPAPQNFQAVKQAVAGEVSKTFKGGQATDAEIKEFNDAISSASSPAQLYGVISTYQDLMDSKRQALMDQYNQGMQHKPNFGNAAKAPAKPNSGKPDFIYVPGKGLVKQ